ncbi:MAG: ABC transporter substrate-binding protein, partial [Deltaproteobacteria bacterium]|nr:ABC transporter substrate-binding protein [Deltaproteobacteria bacterium]
DDFRRTSEFLKQSLKRVGIEVDIRSQDSAAFIKRIYVDHDFGTSISWNAAHPDPIIGVVREFWSHWLNTGTPWTNGSGYKNSEVDALIESAAIEGNPKKRIEIFKTFQNIVLKDLPTLPLLELHFFTVHSSDLKDVVVQGDQVYSSLKNVWFAKTPGTK